MNENRKNFLLPILQELNFIQDAKFLGAYNHTVKSIK